MSDKKPKTRYAVYYGNHFQRVCAALHVRPTELDAKKIASHGTCNKLRKGFKGDPVEDFTRTKIIDYLESVAKAHPQRAEKLKKSKTKIEDCLLRATFRLTDAACALVQNHRLTDSNVFKKDGITRHQVGLLAKGQFAVEKHVRSAARQIVELTGFSGELDDLLEEHDDTHMCHPCIYRINGRPAIQLSLMEA